MIYFSSNHSSVITVLIGITSAMFLKGLISSSMFPPFRHIIPFGMALKHFSICFSLLSWQGRAVA